MNSNYIRCATYFDVFATPLKTNLFRTRTDRVSGMKQKGLIKLKFIRVRCRNLKHASFARDHLSACTMNLNDHVKGIRTRDPQ